jgi:hypothetical protein
MPLTRFVGTALVSQLDSAGMRGARAYDGLRRDARP